MSSPFLFLDFKEPLREQERQPVKLDEAPVQIPDDLCFVALLKDAGDRPRRAGSAPEKTPAEKAKLELQQSIDRLQNEPYEPGAAKLATSIAEFAIAGDIKNLQDLLKKSRKSDEFKEAVDLAMASLEEAGIWLKWDKETKSLVITRPPSVMLGGPKGIAVSISARGEEPKTFDVQRTPLDKFVPLGENREPFEFKASTEKASKIAGEIGQTATTALAKDYDLLRRVVEDVKRIGAFDHAGGFNKVPEGKDKITPLAVAVLERRLNPIFRAVQKTTSDEERKELAEKLSSRLEAVGLRASFDEEHGFCVFMYSRGANDGYSISIPHKRGLPLEAHELRGPKHADPTKPILGVLRIFKEGEDVVPVTIPEAMRALLRRAREHVARNTY